MSTSSLHPFYPPELQLVGYIANGFDLPTLLTLFFGGWTAILGATDLLSRRWNPHLHGWDRLLVLWFVLTGTIHFFFEGYFVWNHTRMVSMQDFFGQLWKEYAQADSRYMISDPFTLCMEAITAVCWGPLSFLVAYLIAKDSPYRHPFQAFVSTGQLYGDVLYYATSIFNEHFHGLIYYRPEAYYYWLYFFFMNIFWIIIPALCLWSSMNATARAFTAMRRIDRTLQANGTANGSLQSHGSKKHL